MPSSLTIWNMSKKNKLPLIKYLIILGNFLYKKVKVNSFLYPTISSKKDEFYILQRWSMNLGDFWWGDVFYYEPKDLNVFDVFKFMYSFWCVNHPSFVQQEPILVGLEPFRCSLLASLLSRMTRYCWFIFYISWVCVLSCVQLFATPWTVAPPDSSVLGIS